MVMCARLIWRRENNKRFTCATCGFCTHNKSHHHRHLQSTSHFLKTVVGDAPRDIKVVIASFLCYRTIHTLGSIAAAALNYRFGHGEGFWVFRQWALGDPLSQTFGWGVHLVRRTQTQASFLRL